MSGPEVTPPDDRLLTEFLAGEGAVRTVYRATAAERAPAALDAAILQAAQAAARPLPRLARRRWQAPMAAAAVLVMSFGVLLQVQRDPVVQQQVLAPPETMATEMAAPTPPAMAEASAALADDNLAAPAPVLRDAPRMAKPRLAEPAKPAPPAPAAPLPPKKAEAERDAFAAPAVAPPPPPVAVAESTQKAADMAMAEESRHEARAAFAPAPMAKRSAAPLAAGAMASRAAPATDAASWLERWAQHCLAPPEPPAVSEWRGLAVTGWAQAMPEGSFTTRLTFAPTVSHQAIVNALGPLAAPQTMAHSQCAQPVKRELRESAGGWALSCECEAAIP